MKPRLLVLLSVLVGLGALVPSVGTAQEATPEGAPDALAELVRGLVPARTDIHVVLPFGPDGLHPDLTETGRVEGICGGPSLVATHRPDAWDCLGADNQVYDPCFENPYAPAGEPGELACLASPFATDVVVLEPDGPLVREKDEVPGGGVEPWDFPWALDLANGERCLLLHDVGPVLAGQAVHYACSEGGTILGQVDHRMPAWTVSYLPADASQTSLVDVVAAWS